MKVSGKVDEETLRKEERNVVVPNSSSIRLHSQ